MARRVFSCVDVCLLLCVSVSLSLFLSIPLISGADNGTNIDRALLMGSSQLYPHRTNIATFLSTLCGASTVASPKAVQQTHLTCVGIDARMVQPHQMIGDNTFPKLINDNSGEYIIRPAKTVIDESTVDDEEDLSFMDELTSLNTTLSTFGTINITSTTLVNDTNITTWNLIPNTNLVINTSLTMFTDTSSNKGLTIALTQGVGPRKLPEILIIQDQQYLPLYSEYREKSLAPALQQILTYAREASYVLLLPSWADMTPNTTDLTSKGLKGYTNRLSLQRGMDDAYHQIEQKLHTWIDNQTYPIPVLGANENPPQPKPTLATIPLGPVFNAIINISTWTNYTYDIYNITSNYTKSYLDGTSNQYRIITPTLNLTGTTHVTGLSLLYLPNGLLTNAGEYVVSLLLFSTMYNRSALGSVIPNYTVWYDVIELDDGPAVENIPKYSIPCVTNEAATQIQQIVDKHVMEAKFSLNPYTWLPPTPPPPPTPTASVSSSSSSSSSSGSSSSSNSSSPSSSPSPTSPSSSSTGVASPAPSSSDVGFKWTWAVIIAGIVVASCALYCCYRNKQTRAKAGYGPMQFDMEKGYEVELPDQ